MCDCFHLAFPNWHAASSGTGAGRRLRAPEPGTEDDSTCDEPSQFTERERPRPQGSSPVEEYPETEKYTDSDKECEVEHDPHHKSGSGKKTKKSGLGSMFEKRSTPKMSKLKEVHSPESGVIVKTAKDGCAEGLVYGGGGKEGIFIKEVVPESPASKSLKLKEGDQILSATVYFDNVSYEDAIQILEHAQAYKVKLCLKRKPDITETEPSMESDVIPEEDVYAPEMREQGKTKRRGDARISWPKFPSFGKGRKSRFTRSHSSSEADEQRKLELSPTTSDTESPIKSQDALKGKKKHKIKLSVLTKRGRISSSEDQDTDAPTSAQMLSPECLESPSGETPEVYVTEDLKEMEDLRREQNDQIPTEPQTVQHKVELITIDSTMKTEDLTVVLADQESPSGIKSPDGKKKKTERSELKMKILGKDKSHKKDAKAKSSPKRLKTLGASFEIADQLENEKSDVIPSFESHTKLQGDQLALDANTQISVPKVEIEISNVALIQKSPKKGEEKTKKDIKQKQVTKTGPTFKLPKIGFSDIATEETIPKMIVKVEECTTKTEQLTTEGTEVKEDPYERLSKSSLTRAKLPKREDIEIPGMEDMSIKHSAKGIKEPKAVFTGHYEDIQAETVQLSIDVDSVKEAVSKLPGFKLPKVDTSGVPIPEEITVIDANAQRISVKTPTKTKHEAHFSTSDVTASPEISKTTVKLPKISAANLTSEEFIMVTQVDFKKHEKEYKTEAKQSDKDIHKREHIIIPGKESAQEVTILQTQETHGTEGIKSEYQSAATFKSKRAKITMPSFGIAKPDIRIPDVGIHLPKQNISEEKGDSVKGEKTIFLQEEEMSKTQTKKKIGGVMSDVKISEIDGIEYIDSVDGSPAKKDGVSHYVTSPKADISFSEIIGEVKDVPDANKDRNIDGAEIKTLEREGKGGKFKIPKVKGPKIDLSLPKKDVDVTLPEAEVELSDIPEVDITLGNIDVSLPEQKMEIKKPELEIKPWQAEGELDGQGSKFKKPKFGIKLPKLKGPEFDLRLSKKDVTLPEAKAEVKLPNTPEIDVTLGTIDVSIPEQNMSVEKSELKNKPTRTEGELDGQGGKFKMPEFGVKMPKIKGPVFDLSSSEKDVEVMLPEATAEVKLPNVEHTEPGIKLEAKAPEIAVYQQDVEGSPSKFKMPTFKLPTFAVGTTDISVEVRDMDKDVKIDGANINKPAVNIESHSVDIEGPSTDRTDHEGKGSKFKMPHLGFSMPKVKGPQLNLSSSQKDVDVTLPEASAEVRLTEAPKIDASLRKEEVFIPEAKVEVTKPQVKIKPLQTGTAKFGITMPKVKGPEIHFGLSKKDGDVRLPEAKAEVKVPDTAKVDVSLGKADVSLPKGKIEVKKPELEMKPLQSEGETDRQGRKFKMPKLGMSMPKVKGPEIHFASSKKDGDVTLPEAKAEVKVPEVELKEPSAKVEIKAPEIKVEAKVTEGSPSKFKMPTFKLPKFGVGTPNISVEVPDMDKDINIDVADINIPDEGSSVHIAAPNIDIECPSIEMKTTGTEQDGKGSKFKMPHLGFSMPKVKGPKMDLSLSKKDVDVKLQETKADVNLPEVDLGKVDISIPEATMEVTKPELEMQFLQTEGELDGQGEKLKMAKFGIKMPKLKGPEFDLSLSKKDGDVTLPQTKDAPKIDVSLGKAEVLIPEAKAELEIKPLQTEVEGQGSMFKMPKFGMSMPKVKGPEFHLGSSKKDVDVTLPEAKADVILPDVELNKPSVKAETKAPGIEVVAKDTEGSPSKFKMPNFSFSLPKVKGPDIDLSLSKKDTDITLLGTKAEIQLPEAPKIDASLGKADILIPEATVEVKKPEVEIKPMQTDIELEGHGSKFQMPKFGITMPKVKGPEIDLSFSKKAVDVTLPEAKAVVELPEVSKMSVDMKPPECEQEFDGQGSKFKMPKFGFSMPKVTGPEIDLSFSKKDVDVKLPEAEAEVELPEAPKIAVDMKSPECEAEIDGQGSKFKMPKFGISMPKVKGPEIDLSVSKKDVGITLPEAKAKVNLPDVELKESSDRVEIKAPEIDTQLGSVKGSPSKFKLPTFKFPKFGAATPNVSTEVPDIDEEIKIDGADMHISVPQRDVDVPEVKAEVHLPEVQVKKPSGNVVIEQQPGVKVDVKLKKPRFSLPKFSFSKPSVKAPEADASLRDVNVEIPEGNVEVKGGEVDIKLPECEAEVDGQGSKFKMPKFGITMPKVTGPEIDLSLSKKDVDITLPEAKAEVQLPDVKLKQPSATVEIKAPETEAQTGNVGGSLSKLKMPTFTLPKFGAATPKVSVEVPDVDKDIKIDGATVDVTAPSIDNEDLSVDVKVKGSELEGSVSKFKIPKFGISMPKVKGPEIDLSLSKKDVDVTLPEAKTEVKLPDAGLKEPSAEAEIKAPEIKIATKGTEGSPSKYKMPTFKLPKFGVGTPSVTIEVPDRDVKIDGGDIKIPEKGLAVDIAAPSIDIEGPSIDIKSTGTEHEGKGSRFKLPSLGFSGPQIKRPDIDLSLSKKDVDVTLPEAKAEVKLPDAGLKEPSAEVEIRAPEIKIATKGTEGSPSKYKMPTFKLPKFGVGTPSATIEVPDRNVKIDGGDIKIPEKGLAVDIAAPSIDFEGPSIDIKSTGTEHEGKGSRFKLPSLGFSGPQIKRPDIDLSLSKKDVDVTLPEAKAEVKLPDAGLKEPSAEVEIRAPDIKIATKGTEGSPSKYKMPTFKLPKFGVGTPSATIEVPDRDVKIDGGDIKIPEKGLAVDIAAPSIDIEGPSIDIKSTGTEHEGKGSRFKLPSLGFSGPQIKRPDIDLSLSKKDVDMTLPEAKAEVKLPDAGLKEPSAEVEIRVPEIKIATKGTEGSPSKYKMPTFKLPKFGVGTPSATIEVPDRDVKIDGADIKIPEKGLAVDIAAPSIDIEGPSIDIKSTGTEHEGKGSKYKLPSLGFSGPQIKRPDIDFSLSKKDVDVTLPEAKAEVKLPDAGLKEPSAEVEIKAPEVKVTTSDTEGSPSKFKMPTFKLPKFGIGTPSATIEVPDRDVKIDGADIKIPEKGLAVDIAASSIDIEGPSLDIKSAGTEHGGKGSKFKLPSLGFSGPQIKRPDIDLSLSKKDVEVTLPEAKAEVKLPDAGLKEPSAEVEIKAPEVKIATKGTEGSPSKYKMPTFKLPKFGVGSPSATIEVPDRDVKLDGADIKIPEEVLTVHIAAPSIDTEGPAIDIKTTGDEHVGKESKFKLPSLGFSGPQMKRPDIDLSLSKKDVEVTLPEAKAEVKLPDAGLKEPSAEVEIKAPEVKIATKGTEGSPSKYKMPTFKLPKFGIGTPSATIEVPDRDVKLDGADIKIPEEVLTVHIAAPSIDTEGPAIDIKTTGDEHVGKESKFKLPSLGFSGPQIKRPDIDFSLSKKDVDVTLPEAKAEVKLPDAELKESSAKVEIDVQTSNAEGSPSKLKMPTFKLPKFGASTSQVNVEVPDVDKEIKVDGADLKLPEAKAEVKLPDVKIKEPVGSISVSQAPLIEGDAKLKKTSWTLPRFSFSKTSVAAPEADVNLDVPKVDVTLPEAKTDIHLPDMDIKDSSGISIEGVPATDLDAKLKKSRFSLPKFSFSKQSSKESKVDVSLPDVEVSLPEGNVDIKQAGVELKPPEGDVELEEEEIKFKMPKFGISMPKVKGPETDLSLSKKDVDVTLPETKCEVTLPDVKIKQPSATVEFKAPEIDAQTGNVEGSPSKLKMPTFSFPKFGVTTTKVSVEVPDVDKDIKTEGVTVEVTAPSIDTEGLSGDVEAKGSELEGSGSKFKMPKFGISMPKVKGPDTDLRLSKKDVDITLPKVKAEVQLPDVKIKQPSTTVEMKAPEIEVQTGNVEGSPSKLKMPTFTLPKFGVATPKVSVEVPDVDKDIKIDGATVDVTAPSIDTDGLSADVRVKGSELEGSGSKFKMPKFGISVPKVKGPEIDLSSSKKDVDVTLPGATAEVKLPSVEVKEPEGTISVPDAPTVEVETKLKRPNWTFPKFSFSRTGGKAPDVDVSVETPKVDITSPEAIVQGPSGAISMEDPPAAELDANLKKTKFSLPRFSFSKSSVKEPEVSAELPRVDVSLPEGEVIVKQPEMNSKAPELEAEHDEQGSKFKLPKFGIALSKAKGPEEDLNASQKDVGIALPDVKAEVKLPEIEVKQSSANVEMKASETEAKSKDVGGSPLKFKMPTLKIPKFGVTVEAPDAEKVAETDGAKPKEDIAVNIKGPSVDIKTDASKAPISATETPKTETDSVDLGSPSKFKLPSFKMPKLSFSRPNPEDEHVPLDTECKEDRLEMEVEPKGESKSPKVTFTSFGEILKNIDVEFDVPKTEENVEVHETDEPSGKQLELKEKETKQDTIKSPERTGWFKFPKFGLSSPSEPAKISEKEEHKDEKSPVGETVDEEISPTCSVQSSDAFADISSAMTSEHVGLSLSSPTKVTVKYSDPNGATGFGEMHSNIITSTTRTELISVEPNLPEKITILSSGVSSSSEDTLRLNSGKIHVITSNIQATPEAQHAKLLTAVQIQSAGGLPLESEANEAASWTVEDSQSSKRTVFERHLVRETSSERSESKETIVITKQITRMFDSSEPISGETASSIQRLRDSVHSEKMRFFDGADK